MKLSKLVLNNFMAYRGRHEIDFTVSDHSPLILFLGENGHGKTTIQHACKWCLYGESKEKKEIIPVINLVNRKAMAQNTNVEEFEMSVELEWEESGHKYNLKRTFEPYSKVIQSPKAILRIDSENPVPTAAIPAYVQRFLAKEISHFFFFDGETQDEFDKMTTNHNSAAFIRSEIEKSLSIPIITDGINWLKEKQSEESIALIKANRENEKIRNAATELENVRKQLEIIQQEGAIQLKRLRDTDAYIETIEKELANIEEAGELTKEIAEIKGQVKTLKLKRDEKLSLMKDFLGDYVWIPLANKLNKIKNDLQTNLTRAERVVQANESLNTRISLLEKLKKEDKCPLCNSAHNVENSKIENEIETLKSELQLFENIDIADLKYKLNEFNKFNFHYETYIKIKDLQKEFDADGADLAVATQRLEEKQNQLSLFGNVDIDNLLASWKSLMADRENANSNIDQYKNDEIELQRKITKYESQIGKGISPQKRIAHNAFAYLISLFSDAKEDYVSLVRKQVETYASETFLKIISDKKYQGLRINNNFGVDLILPGGEVDPLRSTGQGKVSTISLISGLIKTAMDDGFILMDTPFVSLDLGHRQAVCTWASESGFRVSLFMHSGEFVWDRDKYSFGDAVGRIYTIRKLDNDESTIDLELT